MVIMDPDETDSSRLEMDVTPLQKNTRKTRNTRRGKKRKSTEMLEEVSVIKVSANCLCITSVVKFYGQSHDRGGVVRCSFSRAIGHFLC